MNIKFVSDISKCNIFMYRNVVLRFYVKDKNLVIKNDVNKDNKYLDDAISRLKNILKKD